MNSVLRGCLLLLWTLIAPVSCNDMAMAVSDTADGIKISCGSKYEVRPISGGEEVKTLKYAEENTGEYTCVSVGQSEDLSDEQSDGRIMFVKFRTCDNCIELDEVGIAGMVVGNVVATIVIGVAVYLIASQNRVAPTTSNKKSSDRQHLVPNDVSSRSIDDHYQPLKGRQKDTYDVLNRQ